MISPSLAAHGTAFASSLFPAVPVSIGRLPVVGIFAANEK
jgi:hypothetical protein